MSIFEIIGIAEKIFEQTRAKNSQKIEVDSQQAQAAAAVSDLARDPGTVNSAMVK